MAKYSKKEMGKEVGSAEVYAAQHTMSGKTTNVDMYDNYTPGAKVMDQMNMSVGGISKGNYAPINKNGETKIRGTGAATKGTKARGPMA